MSRHKGHKPYHKNTKVMILSIIGVILASLIFMQLKGGTTGYMVYEPRYNTLLVQEFMRGESVMRIAPVDNKGFSLNSLEISGRVIGSGMARVFLSTPSGWTLVYSNRDYNKEGVGFVIEDSLVNERLIRGEITGEDGMYKLSVGSSRDGAAEGNLKDAEVWQVPMTCWETCRLNGVEMGELKLYFEVEEGTSFFLERISVA
jgi:hypothetical protein